MKITKEEAIKLLNENMKMKLVYRSNYYPIYNKNVTSSENKAFLVYEPTLSYISIDAKTGEVYLTKTQWTDTSTYAGASKADSASNEASISTGTQTLTDEETAKIEELKNLITKSKAIDIVTSNKYLYLDKNLKSYTASLSKNDDASGKSTYVWNVNLSDPREINYKKDTDNYRAYTYATVDAQTGKILSFYSSMKSYYNDATKTWDKVKVVYDKEVSKAILEKFLKTQVKDRFDNSILSTQNEDYVVYYNKDESPVYGGYSYRYNRVNEGVEYPDNNINGSVDGVTGKIYSFSTYWNDNIIFESTKGAITADQAMDYYLGKDSFGLKYEINVINKYDSSNSLTQNYKDYATTNSVDYEIRLVYRPDVNPAYISPFTGEQLNYNGEIVTATLPFAYKDITNTAVNRNILLLADMNIGFAGENFLPDKTVTIGELNKLLQDIGYGYNDTSDNDPYANNLLTKEKLAKIFIDKLGLEKVSKLSGIYATGYADENNIGDDYVGAVALAKGLGLMTADTDNNFNPGNNITRAEVVNFMFNFISKSQDGVIY